MSSIATISAEGHAPRVTARSLAVPALLLLAAAIRFYKLGSVPLWTDELFTAAYPRIGLGYLWTEGLRTEPTSPLYYSLIWAIERLFGDSAFALRLPSVAGSLLAIALAGRLARELSDRPLAPIVATLLLALSPSDILLAQEARAYALQVAALALALFGFARFLRERGGLRLYGAGAVLAVWLHPTSLVALAAINAAALLSLLGRARLVDGPALRRWGAANAMVAVCCLPLLPVLLSTSAAVGTNWIERLTRWSFEGLIGATLAGPAFSEQAMRIAEIGIPLLAALFLVPLWRPGRRAATVLLLVPGVFLALMTGISLFKPVLLSRTIAWTLVPFAVALGDVLSRRPKVIALAIIAALLGAAALNLSRLGALKEDWPGFLARLPGLSPPALIVLAPRTSPAALKRYAPDAGDPVRLDDGGPPIPETIVIPRVFSTPTIALEDVERAIAQRRPVWLIYRRPEYEWMRKATADLPAPKLAVQDIDGPNPGIRALRWW